MTARPPHVDDENVVDRLEALLAGVSAVAEDGDLQQALALLDGAPDDLQAFGTTDYVRGALLVQLDRVDEAIVALERAVEREPEVAEIQSNLGAALLEKAQAGGPEGLESPEAQQALSRALAVLTEAAQSHPLLADVHTNHGRALHLSGRLHEAVIAFDRALAIDSVHVPTLYNKAAAYAALGDDNAVIATLDRLLAIEPDFEPAKISRERVRQRLGR